MSQPRRPRSPPPDRPVEPQARSLFDIQLADPSFETGHFLSGARTAYEMILKAAHTFNLLDARGAISVTERAAYIGRIRNLSRAVAQAYFESRERLGFPMLDSALQVA